MPPLLSRIHTAPFLKLLLPLSLGILIQEQVDNRFLYLLPFVSGIIILLCSKIPSTAVSKYKYRSLFGIGTFCLLFSTGAFRLYTQQPVSFFNCNEPISGNAIIRIQHEPEEKKNSWQAYGMAFFQTDSITYTFPLLLHLSKDSTYIPQKSDILSCRLSIYPIQNSGNPDSFDFKTYMRRKGILYAGYTSFYTISSSSTESGLIDKAAAIRAKIRERLNKIYTNPTEQLFINAITLGYKKEIPAEVREDFSKSGLSHILAVSGLHTGILFMLVMLLLWPLRLLGIKRLIYLAAILIMWGYALLTGMSASVVRAVCMITIFLIGKIAYLQNSAINALFITAFGMLLYDPFYLFDVGFQLSFLAVLSILIYQPLFSQLSASAPRYIRIVFDLIYVTLSAQVLVLPLSLYYFHIIPIWFLPANLIILPFLSPLLLCTIFSLALQCTGITIPLFDKALNDTVSLLLQLSSGFGALPSLTPLYPSIPTTLLLYTLIITITFFLINKRASFLIGSLCCLIALLCSIGFTPQAYPSSEIILFNQRTSNAIHFINRHEHYLYSPDTLHQDSSETEYFAEILSRRRLQTPCRLANDTVIDSRIYIRRPFILIAGKRFCMLTEDLFRYKIADTRPQTDYLIIGDNCKSSLTSIRNLIRFDTVIVQPTVPRYRQQLLQKEADSLCIPIHEISRNGAFRLTVYP